MRVLPSLLLATGAMAAAVAHQDDPSADDHADLRRRQPIRNAEPRVTQAPTLASVEMANLFARQTTGDDCLEFRSSMTEVCDVETTGGSTRTVSCSSAEVTESECSAGLTCSLANNGQQVCMELQNTLDIAGVIIAIVFGVAIVLGVATLTWLCCRDRKEQKRLAAKAEATALARAATKKKRAQEAKDQRTPLMREQQQQQQQQRPRDPSGASVDPFHDQNRS